MSAERTDRTHDLRAIVDPMADPLLPAGAELTAFTDAAVLRDAHEMPSARTALLDAAGEAAVIRAAAVAGNFQMMNRLLDAIGVRVHRGGMTIAAQLGLTVPPHLLPR
ncbi:MAG: hypothetical protein OEW83_09650 [Acidimicrobiia bacterium]|nr:hypothetical protein [Acidimicrobiia bacterium]